MNKAFLACIGTALVGAAAGAFAGYQWAKHNLSTQFEQELADELEVLRETYSRANKSGDYETPMSAAAKLLTELPKRTKQKPPMADDSTYPEADVTEQQLSRVITHLKYDAETKPEVWENESMVLTEEPEGEDTMTDRDEPYIISLEVFEANEKDYRQPSLFYWAGNHTLVDSDNDVLEFDVVGGEENMTKFGHMSNEIDSLYIRNDQMCCDFVIQRINDSFGA